MTEFAASAEKSHRQKASPVRLILDAIGGPRTWPGKWLRFAEALRLTASHREMRRRMERLRRRGLIEGVPTRLQLLFGCWDMLRYYIEPGARDYYESRGIGFAFHNFLKFLDDPAAVIDPSGLRTPRDTLIGHVLHVVHANPIYDLQLLEMFEDGLDEIEGQTRRMLAGTHPRQRTIGAIVEDPEYHARLLDYILRYRRDPSTPMLHRRAGQARRDPSFTLAEATYGTLDGSFRYFCRLPTRLRDLVRHARECPRIDPSLCDPEVVAAHRRAYSRAGSGAAFA